MDGYATRAYDTYYRRYETLAVAWRYDRSLFALLTVTQLLCLHIYYAPAALRVPAAARLAHHRLIDADAPCVRRVARRGSDVIAEALSLCLHQYGYEALEDGTASRAYVAAVNAGRLPPPSKVRLTTDARQCYVAQFFEVAELLGDFATD